jgi:NAD(P)-dependent dehydrogenase (short-subunit alcohol dehydrogenase family)
MHNSHSRVLLITGAGQRLGRVLALGLAKPGMKIALHCNRSRQAAEALVLQLSDFGVEAQVFQADLAAPEGLDGLIGAVCDQFQRPINALINNAAVFDYDSGQSAEAAVFKQAMTVNCWAPVALAQAMVRHADPAQDNVVINILDQKLNNLNPDFFSYTLSKAALGSATLMLDMAFGAVCRVCGVAPGILFASFDQTPAEFAAVAEQNPMHKAIAPSSVVEAVRFILEAPYFRRQIVPVDNGQRLWPSARDIMFNTR